MSLACFGKILIRVLLSKHGGSLVSSTQGVCEEVVRTRYMHNDIAHESGRKLTLPQVIRQEVTPASRQAPEKSDLLTLWTTQHPCIMCAAALRFLGIGKVCYIADDPSDDSPTRDIIASRGTIAYEALGDRIWWTVSNLLFLYNSAVKQGEEANNLRKNRDRYPALVQLTLQIAKDDPLGKSARAGVELPQALLPYTTAILHTAAKSDP